jgi:short-subunit dehydrogenase
MTTREPRTALLTGASGEIGGRVAMLLADRGIRLALSARRAERLGALGDRIEAAGGAPAAILPADLGRRGEAVGLAERAVAELGTIDVLVNNAGASMQGLTWVAGDRDEAREVLETNLWSPLALSAALVQRMLDQGVGAIVNVGSMVRVSPFPHLGHYAVSRSALATATEVLAMELGPRGIRVVEVALGPVDTPASRENRVLAGAEDWLDGRPGLGSPASAARRIAHAVTGDDRGIVFYPGALRIPHRFPALGRRYSRRTARRADLRDETVRFGGSTGDPDLVAARAEGA